MSAPHRSGLTSRREPIALEHDPDVQQAAEHYLYWSGQPLTHESKARTSSHIRRLYTGQPVARDELHVQLVVDELLEGLKRAS